MYYCADFETTVPDTVLTDIEDMNTRVWSWGVVELDSPESFTYGTDIKDFIDWCSKVKKRVIYFHNLKFDGKFLIDFLIRNHFVYDPDRKTDNSFTCLISEYGHFYSIEVTFKAYKKDRKSTIFYDSLKKLPLSVAKIAKSFNLSSLKGEIDYKKDRPVGYSPTDEELEYLFNDVWIVAQALSIQHQQNLKRMTIGGDALFHYKTITGKNYRKWFPDILDNEGRMFLELKRFYRGGFTYVNPTYQGIDIGEGVTYDCNSMYPSVMKNDLLPYGQPIYYSGKYNTEFEDIYPLYCQTVVSEFRLKKGHIPFVCDKTGFFKKSIEYIENTLPFKPVVLHLTNIELELFYEHYDIITISYEGGYMFKGRHGMFNDYIDHWTEIKEQADKDGNSGLRQIAKLMLNSLYGKFGKNIFMGGKIPEFDYDSDIVRYKDKPVKLEQGEYIPIAIFVTSYARNKMIRTAQSNYDRFIYCDTDSCHLVGTSLPLSIEIDPYKLGAWKEEDCFIRARYLRPKAYVLDVIKENGEKKFKVKCSGMTEDIKEQVSFENFYIGLTLEGKKLPRTISGGVVFIDTTYTLTA
jgi:hypothetical protein